MSNSMKSSVSLSLMLQCLVIYFLVRVFSFEGDNKQIPPSRSPHDTHTVQLNSLLPSTTCQPFIRGQNKRSTIIELVYKYGPCSYLKDLAKYCHPEHAQIIEDDRFRVGSIQRRIVTGAKAHLEDDLGRANYLVNLGLGTPEQDLPFVLDTARVLTWVKCKRLVRDGAHNFYPFESDSFEALKYDIHEKYFDGYLNEERLHLTSQDIHDNFLFACTGANPFKWKGYSPAGIFGLGRDKVSFLEQTKGQYQHIFSYCIPSKNSYTGYLSFGDKLIKPSTQFTSLINTTSMFYAVGIVGISVGGRALNIDPTILPTSQIPPVRKRMLLMIIDIGTEVTRLPSSMYNIMKEEFQNQMSIYPKNLSYGLLDTCYDLSRYESVTIPTIEFYFSDQVRVSIDPSGILYTVSKFQVCLAFAATNKRPAILGTMQQKKVEVVYDVGRRRVGFNQGGCD